MSEQGRVLVIGPERLGSEIESTAGTSVVVEETTADGLSRLDAAEAFDGVVVDHDPPARDALSLLDAVSSLPVILAPTDGSSELATAALAAGAAGYVDRATVEDGPAAVAAAVDRHTGSGDADEAAHAERGGDTDERLSRTDVDERIDKAASTLSHELRGPIQRASSGIDLARTECDSEYLDEVAKTLDRMNRLIDTLLEQLKYETTTPDVEPVDLATVVDEAWGDRRPATLTVESSLPTILAEETRLRQLLENLFRNAIDHAGEAVTVRFGVFESGGTDGAVGFYVADNGPGIDDNLRELVFEYGYTGSADGTGYGLGIVAEIAEAFGWGVSVTESRDGGARFEIVGITEA